MGYKQYSLQKNVTLIFILAVLVNSATHAQQTNSDSCILPDHPINGLWFITNSTNQLKPGENVPSGTTINVRCDGKYKLDGRSIITCKNGSWTPNLGKCLELCPPIVITPSTIVNCTSSDGKILSDCKNALHGTVATFKCAPFYENPDLNRNPFRICHNGSWNNEIPTCTPICGVKPEAPSENKRGYYPWNVAVFKTGGKNISLQCTGTLINEKIILTSARCVTNNVGIILDLNLFKIAAGKTSALYDDSEDTEVQFSNVQDIFIGEEFKGSIRKYTNDIAIIVARTSFNMTKKIQPVCFDWSGEFLKECKYPGTKGYIPGPLKSQEFLNLKPVFEIEVPFLNDTQCYSVLKRDEIVNNFQAFYTYDKLCSGYINSSQTPMCLVDDGSGLISPNQYKNKYYITGILSVKASILQSTDSCDGQLWVLFTGISKFRNFIVKKNDLYKPIKRSYFQTSCGTKSVQAQPLIVNGTNVTKGEYPWQVALYKVSKTNKRLICGGSLINQRVILTAAHCVTDIQGDVLSKQQYVVAVGKYFRDFDDPRDTVAQFSTLKDIFVPNDYRGSLQNYLADIAILITENSFTLTKDVEPVCLDWEVKYENQFLKPSSSGYVTGWGLTEERDNPSEVLRELKVPYIEQNECKELLPPDYDIYLTVDKLCSGHLNKGSSVCNGDSGGGLVFKNPNDDRYYLAGIVSLAPQAPTGGCDSQQLSLYTRVSEYISNFIIEKARLYWA